MAAYRLAPFGVIRTSDGLPIPRAPGDPDWVAYLAWVALGNVPDPIRVPLSGQRASTVVVAAVADVSIDAAGGLLAAGQVIDGHTLVEGEYVLLTVQADVTQNGIYVVPASGAASRPGDFAEWVHFVGLQVYAYAGSLYAESVWGSLAGPTGTIGVDALQFIQESSVLGRSLVRRETADGMRSVLGLSFGTHTLWVPASEMVPQTTNGPTAATIELATNKIMVSTLNFDSTTQQFAQFGVGMPASWDLGVFEFFAVWSHPATATNFGVVWGLDAVAIADGDPLDTAFGSSVIKLDVGGTTDVGYRTGLSSSITPAGNINHTSHVIFRIHRDPANVSDTLAVNARLHGIGLVYATNKSNDDTGI